MWPGGVEKIIGIWFWLIDEVKNSILECERG